MSRTYASAAAAETWAIDPGWLKQQLALADSGVNVARQNARRPEVRKAIAVLPMHGVISQRESIWTKIFGGCPTESFGAAFAAAVNNPGIAAVVVDVDSPGGTISGVPELAELIHRGSKVKPVYCLADTLCASAAYWLGSQGSRLLSAPSAELGSIGVYRVHVDYSEALAKDGVRVEFLSVPEYKTEANPYQPLSADGRDHHMGQVRAAYDQFLSDVARGRRSTPQSIHANYGRGRMYHAAEAVSRGMADDTCTLGELLGRLGIATGRPERDVNAESMRLERQLCDAWRTCPPAQILPDAGAALLKVDPRMRAAFTRKPSTNRRPEDADRHQRVAALMARGRQ